MRAPLKYLAPLILLPFLACTDTPGGGATFTVTFPLSSSASAGPTPARSGRPSA